MSGIELIILRRLLWITSIVLMPFFLSPHSLVGQLVSFESKVKGASDLSFEVNKFTSLGTIICEIGKWNPENGWERWESWLDEEAEGGEIIVEEDETLAAEKAGEH